MPSKRLQEALRFRSITHPDYDGLDRLSPRRLAFHEAGHAVANVLVGIYFDWVVATKRDGWVNSANPCVGWRRGDGAKATLARTWAIATYAGAAAEECLGEGVAASYLEWESAEYWLEGFATPRGAQHVGDETHRRQVARLKDRARMIMRENFASVARVAESLLEIQALRREEVISIMEGGRPPRR